MGRRIPLPTILVDSNEQLPWTFRSKEVVEEFGELPVEKANLFTADYSVGGLTSVVLIERKSLDDFVQSVTHGRERFWQCLGRMKPLQHRAVIVEADQRDAARGAYRSNATPSSVIRSASAIMYDFGIPVIWRRSREKAEREAAWWLVKAWKDHRPRGGEEA